MRRQARRLPTLRFEVLSALVLGGMFLAHPPAALADEVASPEANTARAVAAQPVTAQSETEPAAATADAALLTAPASREETGRSTAKAGDPFGSLVPVQTMPRVHLVEPTSSGAFASPDPSVDGSPSTFSRSALAVPRGFELRPAAPAAGGSGGGEASDGQVPSLAEATHSSPPSLASIGGPAEVVSGSLPPTPAGKPVDGGATPVSAGEDTPPGRQAAAVPVAPVQAPTAPAGDADKPDLAAQAKPEPAAILPRPMPQAAEAPRTVQRVAPPHRLLGAAAAARPATDRPVRIERVRRETSRPRPARHEQAERYDDLPALAPLPPGVLPAQ